MSPRRFVPRDGSLADSVLEIDSQIESGDFDQEVLLTGPAWARLVREAQDNLEDGAVDRHVHKLDALTPAFFAKDQADELEEHREFHAELRELLGLSVATRTQIVERVRTLAKDSVLPQWSPERAELVSLRAQVATSANVAELTRLRAFEKDAIDEIGKLTNERDHARNVLKPLSDEAVELRAFAAAVHRALNEHGGLKHMVQVIEGYVQAFEIEQSHSIEEPDVSAFVAELTELREFKAKRIARNVDGSEYTFSTLAPEVEAFLGQDGGCHVRFLLDDGAGCVLDFRKAREVAHDVLTKVDAALFVPEKKPKKARGKKMFCGRCNADTKHDGNDECTTCAAKDLVDAEQAAVAKFEPVPPPRQIELTDAISRKRPTRRTKKFPKGEGLSEKCTQCGAELGAHDGTKCPQREAA